MSADALTKMVFEQIGNADSEIKDILMAVAAGKELTVREATELWEARGPTLWLLVKAADLVRCQQVGDVVTYVKNRNINFTNVCVGSCKFCAFARSPNEEGGYLLSKSEIKRKVHEAVVAGATEVCVQGGLHPELGLSDYLEILQAIREVSPTIHIHAFSPAEIDHISKQEGASVEEVLLKLKGAGVNSMPGTAAEILSERVRRVICPSKIGVSRWVKIIRTAHELGIPTTATILYGTVETPAERASHLALLREIQKETQGFTEFIPLAFMPKNTELAKSGITSPPALEENLKMHAIARLMLGGWIPNLQTSWVKLGPEGAQLMLMAGANDLGGTLMEENITRAAGGTLTQLSEHEIRSLILGIGRTPKQRTTLYQILD